MKDGKIEKNWLEIALKKLNTIFPNSGACRQCGAAGSVTVAGDLVTPVVMSQEGSMMLGGTSYPHVLLTCRRCGNSQMFNYVILSQDEPQLDLGDADA